MPAHRKPNHLHVVDGTGRDDRGTSIEDPATGDLKTPPADISPEARVVWMRIIANMPDGLLRALDFDAFRMLCQHIVERDKAYEKVKDMESVVKTTQGNIIINPFLSALNRQTEIVMKMCSELGLTPVGRSRLLSSGAVRGKAKDSIEERYFK